MQRAGIRAGQGGAVRVAGVHQLHHPIPIGQINVLLVAIQAIDFILDWPIIDRVHCRRRWRVEVHYLQVVAVGNFIGTSLRNPSGYPGFGPGRPSTGLPP